MLDKVIVAPILIILIALSNSCTKNAVPVISMPIENYKLVEVASEDSTKFIKAYHRSKNEFNIDFKSGKFYGHYDGKEFSGKYEIKKVTSGFVKGFNYQVELGSLMYESAKNKKQEDFFGQIAAVTRIFVSPTINDFIMLELKDESQNLKFFMKRN